MNDLKGIIEDCNKSDLVSDKVIKKVIEIIGQEEWQILHDENSDICTTMGELIITLKDIPYLEKENAELRNNGFTVSAMTEQQLKVALEKGEQLEKENTELKKKLKKARNIIKHLLIMLHEKELYGVYVSIAQDFMAEEEKVNKEIEK